MKNRFKNIVSGVICIILMMCSMLCGIGCNSNSNVTFEEYTGKQHKHEYPERIKDGSPRTVTVRQSNVEESIMERSIKQSIHKYIPQSAIALHLEITFEETRYKKYQHTRNQETYTGKQHFTACHRLRYAELIKTQLY